MKGIILAGGAGTRLYPTTLFLNKHLLPIYNKPAIFYSLELFKNAGITDTCLIAEHKYTKDFEEVLGDGANFDIKLQYINDTHVKKGPASAISYARQFVDCDDVVVVFADGIYDINISEEVSNFNEGCLIFGKEVSDPSRFGIIEVDSNHNVLSLEEKPINPRSNLAFTGLAIYDNKLFDYIDQIKPGLNNEYYTTDVHEIYLRDNQLRAKALNGFWQDMGTHEGLYLASKYWYEKLNP